MGGWRASTPSRSVDREREESWARVERKGPEASVNSYRGSPKGLTDSMREIISTRYDQLEMEQRT